MARSDLLVNLVKAGSSGDRRLMRSTVEAIIAEERSKQHNILAERLAKAMNGTANGDAHLNYAPPENTGRGRDFLVEVLPRRRLEDIIMPSVARLVCDQLVEEQQRANILRMHGLEPRHRILLVGPPGNGKTSLAEAIAESLALPLFVVRYEQIIGSYLGETATRLKRVFDYVRTTPCVLFFDEFDAVGKERGDKHETGEVKRVVSSLLMQIDELPSYTVVVAATNHSELLDKAVWRRFQLRIELPMPRTKELAVFIHKYLQSFNEPLGMGVDVIARRVGAVSYGEAEQFCLDVLRRHALSLGDQPLKVILAEQLRIWAARVGASSEVTGGINFAAASASQAAES